MSNDGAAALRRLVRRDIRGFAASAALALAALAALGVWALDWLGSPAPALVLGLAGVAGAMTVFRSGPRIPERFYTLAPAALAVTPVAVAVGALLSPLVGLMISVLAGLAAAFVFTRSRRA